MNETSISSFLYMKNPFFYYFQFSFRSSRSTGVTLAVVLNISQAFSRVWHTGLPHMLKSYGISGRVFGLILSYLSNWHLRVVLDGKSLQGYSVDAGVPLGSNLGPRLSLLYINDLLDVVIAIYPDGTTLYSKCDLGP